MLKPVHPSIVKDKLIVSTNGTIKLFDYMLAEELKDTHRQLQCKH